MQTLKQYYIQEASWNPQVSMKRPGDPARSREHMRAKPRKDATTHTIAQAERIISSPDAVDIQTGQQVLDALGTTFDKTPHEHMKQDILKKYRELRDLLKNKSASANEQNIATVMRECVDIAKQLITMLDG